MLASQVNGLRSSLGVLKPRRASNGFGYWLVRTAQAISGARKRARLGMPSSKSIPFERAGHTMQTHVRAEWRLCGWGNAHTQGQP